MKKILMILLCGLFLVGCGESVSNGQAEIQSEFETEPTEFEVNVEQLESDGYSDIAGIAYGKVELGEGIPTVHLVYYRSFPVNAAYLMFSVEEELDYDCDILIDWKGEIFNLDADMEDPESEEEMYSYFPEDWKEVLEKMQSGVTLGNQITKDTAETIDEEVKNFVSGYLSHQTEKGTLIPETEQVSESEIISSIEYNYNEDSSINCLLYNEEESKSLMVTITCDQAGYDFSSVCYMMSALELSSLNEDVDFIVMINFKDQSNATLREKGELMQTGELDIQNASPTEDDTDKSLEFQKQLKEFLEENNLL